MLRLNLLSRILGGPLRFCFEVVFNINQDSFRIEHAGLSTSVEETQKYN